MGLDRAGRGLLALCGHRSAEAGALTEGEWQALAERAHDHRVACYLHARMAREEIACNVPADILHGWHEAYRDNAIRSLSQRRALLQAVDALAQKGIGAVALKGSALAWTVHASPVEREMRDIDLMVSEENIASAYAALRQTGWDGPDLAEDVLRHLGETETHLPALESPEGVVCELHARLWAKSPLPGSPMPKGRNPDVLSSARLSEQLGAAVPSAPDMLAHLVVHAACSHLFNTGPMVLIDIDLWCARRSIDWPKFWEGAARDGAGRPAALLFALVERWRRPGFLDHSQCPTRVEPAVLDEAELLLVQDLERRKDVSVIASLSLGRLRGRIARHSLDAASDRGAGLGRIGEIAARARSLAASLLSAQTRRNGLATARLQKWMEG